MSQIQIEVLSKTRVIPVVLPKVDYDEREVVRCGNCGLVQFETCSLFCRRCHKSLYDVSEEEVVVEEKTALKQTTKQMTFCSQSLAEELRNRRKILRLSQRQLAELMGCPRTYVSKVENNKVTPTLASLYKFAKCLKTSLSRLLNGTSTFFPTPTRDEIEIIKSLRLLSAEDREQKEQDILLFLLRKILSLH